MPTIHTQTSLKKIKKDELVQMFLDQQAKLNDIEMDLDDERSETHHWKGKWFYLKDQYDKLKEEIDDIKDFLKVCDRNSDGYYEHYETRQIATRVEGGEYKKED